jgi:hypothetical protein
MLPIPTRRKKLHEEPVFQHPPLWIHESVAAKCFRAPDKARLPARQGRKGNSRVFQA